MGPSSCQATPFFKVFIRAGLPQACDHPNVVLPSDGFHGLVLAQHSQEVEELSRVRLAVRRQANQDDALGLVASFHHEPFHFVGHGRDVADDNKAPLGKCRLVVAERLRPSLIHI